MGIFRSQYDQSFSLNSADNYHPRAPQIYALVNNIYSIFSQIKKDVINERLKKGFIPSFDYIGFSKFKDKINLLNNYFNRILIIDFVDLTSNRYKTLKKIFSFLRIEFDITNIDRKVYN